jgi:hypothetical protein
MAASPLKWLPKQVLSGHDEPIFRTLPADLLANLRTPRSENALIWNLFYPLARPTLSLERLCSLRPLFGTPAPAEAEDFLIPYFWGWSVKGERMAGLDETLAEVDGGPGHTEADILLLGKANLVLVEAKRFSGFGRCGRHMAGRCPEVHREEAHEVRETGGGAGATCRYWSEPEARFDRRLDFGPRPDPSTPTPPCARHYQLARLVLLGEALAERLECAFHFWVVAPRREWRGLEADWRAFVERIRSDRVWRQARVLAWEDVRGSAGSSP